MDKCVHGFVLGECLACLAVDYKGGDSTKQLRAEIEKRNSNNDRRVNALNQELAGQGKAIDPQSIVRTMLSSLIEHLFGDMDSPERLAFEDRYTRSIETMLRTMEGEVRRARLTAGIHLR